MSMLRQTLANWGWFGGHLSQPPAPDFASFSVVYLSSFKRVPMLAHMLERISWDQYSLGKN